MKQGIRICIRMPEDLLKEVNARGETSNSIREGLSRYFELLTETRGSIKDMLDKEELEVIADEYSVHSVMALSYPGHKELNAKLSGLSSTQRIALRDAVIRYQIAKNTGIPIDVAGILE